MHSWMLIFLFPAARFLINLDGWRYLSKAKRKHYEYIKGIPNSSDHDVKARSEAAAGWLTSNIGEIKRRVHMAGVDNPTRPYMDPAGYGFVAKRTITVLDNILFQNADILGSAQSTLSLAAGACKTRAIQSINPLYWVEFLVFLPKQLVAGVGVDTSSNFASLTLKVVQIVYWAAVAAAFILKPEVFNLLFGHTGKK